jgi:hypothetical protein
VEEQEEYVAYQEWLEQHPELLGDQ